ncbi:MAG: TPM domain-containing protein, partial [Bacillota bacterium]|nr:TPM domain-containing protein [Bacillota bacterium]
VLFALCLPATSISFSAPETRIYSDYLSGDQMEALEKRLEEFYKKTKVDLGFSVTMDLRSSTSDMELYEFLDLMKEQYRIGESGPVIMVAVDDTMDQFVYTFYGDAHSYINENALNYIFTSVLDGYRKEYRMFEGVMYSIDLIEAAILQDDRDAKLFDFADILTDEEERILKERIVQFKQKHQVELAYFFSDSLSYNVEFRVYLLDLFYYLDFGYNGRKDGILFGLDMQERDYFTFTTGKAQDLIQDEKLEDNKDRFVPLLSDSRYFDAVNEHITLMDQMLSGDLDKAERMKNFGMGVGISALVALIITAISAISQKIVVRKSNATEYIVPGSVKITQSSDLYTHTTITRTKVKSESSGGGGSFSGSSGGSGGGAGGKF